MIYLQPVKYVEADLDFVRRFERSDSKQAGYWTNDACSGLKTVIKQHYRRVQNNICCYCRQVIPVDHGRVWDTEHIVPRNLRPDFMFIPQNLALSCPDCNGPKSDKETLADPSTTTYPTTSDAFLIVHPHFDNYAEHVQKGDYLYVPASGSAKGKWTISNCNLSRFAGREFMWPDPIPDDRFEDLVDDVFDGNAESARAIIEDLTTSGENATSAPDSVAESEPV